MLSTVTRLTFAALVILVVHCKANETYYESLFLTPLITDGKIEEARRLSSVELFKEKVGATAYSGYITTTRRILNSHLFFLHIRALEGPTTAPLMLWLQGGPGLSSLFGQFLEIGPLGMDANGRLFRRKCSLQRYVNVVYLDQPVGAGFSYKKGLLGYAKNLNDVATGVLEFLRQFLIMFPEYKGREFYIGGESYGARFTVGVAHAFHTRLYPKLDLRLEGVILGAGFLGRLLKVADSSDFLYETSMISKKQRDKLEGEFKGMRKKAKGPIGKLTALLDLLRTIFTSEGKPTLFQRLTGYNNHASALYTEKPENMLKYEAYVQTDEFKRAVHVGKRVTFQGAQNRVARKLASDYLTDISHKIEDLLRWFRVLFYTGQMDTLFPSRNLQDFFRSLNWTGAAEFRKKESVRWRAYKNAHSLSGLVTQVGNMTEVVLLGAGHYAAVDKPRAANRMMVIFIKGLKWNASSETKKA